MIDKHLYLILNSKYGIWRKVHIDPNIKNEEIEKLIDHYVEDYKKELKTLYMVEYRQNSNIQRYMNQKFYKKENAINFMNTGFETNSNLEKKGE